MNEWVQKWTAEAEVALVGLTVRSVRYLTKPEVAALGWSKSSLVIEFDDGSFVFAASDDEGNNGGALLGQTAEGRNQTFPTIGVR